ncbi:MAG: heme o synthase [Thaumarchaeota archaeon]|nr:heme o synthase [Candidatus Calditenuaceae archaeon]MDW8186454.1 heme o synthase [Nitrososphaerota archaeon]
MQSQTKAVLTPASSFKIYFKLTKPNVWWLLVYTGIGGFFVGSGQALDLRTLALTTLALICGSAGSETISNYIERETDSMMSRTRRRPLPSGAINPPEKALWLGIALTSAGIFTSALINVYALSFMIVGILDYLVVYVLLTKKRTPLNIILGSFSGGAPAMIGYVSSSGTPAITGWLLAALVVLWIPGHVWSLALRYKEDYRRAGIPMLPVVVNETKAIRCIVSTVMLLVAFSLMLPLVEQRLGTVYFGAALVTGALLIYLSFRTAMRPDFKKFWRLFKFTSPHLAILFAAMMVDLLL